MAQAVATHKVTVVPRRTMRKLSISELNNESEQSKRLKMDVRIKAKLDESVTFPPKSKDKAPDVNLLASRLRCIIRDSFGGSFIEMLPITFFKVCHINVRI